VPIAIGHALVGIVVVIAVLLGLTLPLALIRWLVAAMLVALEIFLFAAPAAGQIPARHHLSTTVTLLGGLVATALDTAAYLAVTGLIAWVVDAVVATGVITLMM
jgi:hypothetical protein